MDSAKSRISLIAAIGKSTRAIGKDNRLLWSLPEDLKRFKALTDGHPVIMGRKTWDSLPERYRPLPGRTNIVVTRSGEVNDAVAAHSLEEAFAHARTSPGNDEVFVIGGGELYRLALPHADRLYLTLVDDNAEGDTFFPEYDEFSSIASEEAHEGSPPYTFLTLER